MAKKYVAASSKSGYSIGRDNQKPSIYLQKCMANYAVSYAKSHGLNQTDLANKIGVVQGTISKWAAMEETARPNLFELLKICTALGISMEDLINGAYQIIEEDESEQTSNENIRNTVHFYLSTFEYDEPHTVDKTHDTSERHFERLSMFEGKEYVALYLSIPPRAKGELNRLYISTGKVDARGFCPFTMKINDQKKARYSGKIVSPPSTFYTYFYLTGGDPIERGIWVLYYPTMIEGEYRCGNGVLLSMDRSTHSPSFQRIVFIEQQYYKSESLDQYLKESLKEKFPESVYPIIRFSQQDLEEKHKALYTRIFSTESP